MKSSDQQIPLFFLIIKTQSPIQNLPNPTCPLPSKINTPTKGGLFFIFFLFQGSGQMKQKSSILKKKDSRTLSNEPLGFIISYSLRTRKELFFSLCPAPPLSSKFLQGEGGRDRDGGRPRGDGIL